MFLHVQLYSNATITYTYIHSFYVHVGAARANAQVRLCSEADQSLEDTHLPSQDVEAVVSFISRRSMQIHVHIH